MEHIAEKSRTATLTDKIRETVKQEINLKPEEQSGFFASLFKKKNPLERKIKLSKKQMEKGYVVYLWIYPNGQLKIEKVNPKQQVAYNKSEETYHMSSAEYIMRYNKYPVAIQYVESVEPIKIRDIDPITLEEDAKLYGKGLNAERFFIRLMEEVNANLIAKGKKGGKLIIWVIIGVVVIYLITQALGVKLF